MIASFTCEHEGKRYRSLEKFNSGPNGCAKCLCVDGKVDCDETLCKQTILVDKPAPSAVPHVPVSTERNTQTTPQQQPRVSLPPQGSDKGPSSPDLAYYASQLTDVSSNQDKGPASAGMGYMPEQYSYLQAAQAGAPGQRGPPGPPGQSGPQGFQGKYINAV